MKNQSVRILAILILLLSIALACENPLAEEKTVTITEVGWTIENVDATWWPSNPPEARCFINFWIVYEEDDLTSADIKSVRTTNPIGSYWLSTGSSIANNLSTANGYFRARYYCILDSPALGHAIPIGSYNFEITLTNGRSDSFNLTVPAPGATLAGPNTYTYTEDHPSPDASFVAMPRRAAITSATWNSATNTIDVVFSVDSTVVFSGWVAFFDVSDHIVADTYDAPFQSYGSGAVASYINGGIFSVDGAPNSISIAAGDLYYSTGAQLSDIAKVRIFLTDGEQYLGTTYTYDTRSISAVVDLTVVP